MKFCVIKLMITVMSLFATGKSFAETALYEGVEWCYTRGANGVYLGDGEHSCISNVSDGCIITPERLNGLDVVGINPYAFDRSDFLKAIIVREGVSVICAKAFNSCAQLRSVKLPCSARCQVDAFVGCTAIESVSMGMIAYNGFSRPYTVAQTFKDVFPNAANIKDLEIVEGTTKLYQRAYGDLGILRSITLPKSLEYWNCYMDGSGYLYSSYLFNGCEVLTAPSGVPVYKIVRDVSKIREIRVPDGTITLNGIDATGCDSLSSFVVPSSVTTVSSRFDRQGLTSLTIPPCLTVSSVVPKSAATVEKLIIANGAITIGNADLVKGCSCIGTVVIPDSVESIDIKVFGSCASIKSVELPARFKVSRIFGSSYRSIASVNIPVDTEIIGDEFLKDCTGVVGFEIPQSVRVIGNSAFSNCSWIKQLELSTNIVELGDYVFSGCSGLTELGIPGNIKLMGVGVFMGCSSLTNVVVQNGVEMISGQAFKSCEKLTTVSLPLSIRNICDSAFQGCSDLRAIEIPYGTTEIGAYAFDGCESLESVVIPDTVTKIGAGAFRNCKKLVEINVPDSVETIGDNAFSGCVNLGHVILPNALANVGSGLFRNCTMLEAIDIPESVVSIGAYAFDGCNNLKNIVVPDCITSIRNVFPSSYAGIESIKLTQGRRSVENGMFDGCASVTNIVVPADICDIMDNAFRGCAALKEIDIPGCVTNIGKNAFSGCGVLRRVGIPASVQKIGQDAFVGCPSIRSVSMERADWGLKELFSDSVGLIEEVSVGGLCIQSSRFFDGCRSLVSVSAPDDCELYAWTFKNPKYEGSLWVENGWVLGYDGALSASVVVPASYVKIGGGAFDGEEIVEEVTFENGIEVAGGFSNCSELQRINFAGTEWRIGAYAFYNDTYLDNVVIPSSVVRFYDRLTLSS